MRDDSLKWTPPTGLTEPIDLDGASLRRLNLPSQTLISGPAVRDDTTSSFGWPEVVTGQTYRITLRRDRVVEIGGAATREGWDDATGTAASDISDGWAVFELSGPAAFQILKRGTEISLELASASVARKLFGLDVWLYRHGREDCFRLHIVHAFSEALLGNLKAAAALRHSPSGPGGKAN